MSMLALLLFRTRMLVHTLLALTLLCAFATSLILSSQGKSKARDFYSLSLSCWTTRFYWKILLTQCSVDCPTLVLHAAMTEVHKHRLAQWLASFILLHSLTTSSCSH